MEQAQAGPFPAITRLQIQTNETERTIMTRFGRNAEPKEGRKGFWIKTTLLIIGGWLVGVVAAFYANPTDNPYAHLVKWVWGRL